MKHHLHDFADALWMIPAGVVAMAQETGPSWKVIASAVCGGAFTILTLFGGYWISEKAKTDDRQDTQIAALKDNFTDAKVTVGAMNQSLGSIERQLSDLNRKFDQRDQEERADLRAKGQPK